MGQEGGPSPAEIYEELFVPALFGPWGGTVADSAGIRRGHRVLDVACGTGVLARAAAERVGAEGAVVGLDANDEMLAVARRVGPGIEWRQGQAESLPFEDEEFDSVVSQFGFMFFEDQAGAIREMMRVLRRGGRLAVAVCDAIDHSPGYAVLTELLHRLFGPDVAQAFRAPFVSGDQELMRSRFEEAGVTDAQIERHDGYVQFASVEALVAAERACAWTLGGLLDEEQFERLLEAVRESFEPFTTPDGSVKMVMPALISTAVKS